MKNKPSRFARRILIIGPQGSGKTTQAEILAKRMGLGLLKAGTMLRRLAEKDNEEGRLIRGALKTGGLVDNHLTSRVVRQAAESPGCRKGFISDAYPRDMEQIGLYDPDFDKVVVLEISDDEAARRLIKRAREDDTLETIAERLKVYHQVTESVINYYEKEGKVIRIDASQPVEKVSEDIWKKVQEEKRWKK